MKKLFLSFTQIAFIFGVLSASSLHAKKAVESDEAQPMPAAGPVNTLDDERDFELERDRDSEREAKAAANLTWVPWRDYYPKAMRYVSRPECNIVEIDKNNNGEIKGKGEGYQVQETLQTGLYFVTWNGKWIASDQPEETIWLESAIYGNYNAAQGFCNLLRKKRSNPWTSWYGVDSYGDYVYGVNHTPIKVTKQAALRPNGQTLRMLTSIKTGQFEVSYDPQRDLFNTSLEWVPFGSNDYFAVRKNWVKQYLLNQYNGN